MTDPYLELAARKLETAPSAGFEVPEGSIHPMLFDWQRSIVRWALHLGRAAVFSERGTGKTIIQCAWASHVAAHTSGRAIIICPLAVAHQTVDEAARIGVAVRYARSQAEVDAATEPLVITNYDMAIREGAFDWDAFSGVVLDECFAPDTLVDTPGGPRPIRDLRPGDLMLNASGVDVVSDVHRREVPYAVRVSFSGKRVLCSPNHPWFTGRGWVGAQDIQPGDRLMETAAGLRMVREGVHPSLLGGREAAVLRDVLLSEMADGTAGERREAAHAGGESEALAEAAGVLRVGVSGSGSPAGTVPEHELNGGPGGEGETLPPIEGHEAQTFRAWGQWNGVDAGAIEAEGCARRRMDSGVCLVTGPTDSRLSHALQARLSQSRAENSHRGGWSLAPQSEGAGPEEGGEAGFARVDGVEVLELGHPDLARYRDADGKLYFYDLGGALHPSFSVSGALVHNRARLKEFTSKTRQVLIDAFRDTPYRLACTATPSPNDTVELGNHSEFLGVMTSGDMLTAYFTRDSSNANTLRLKGHAVKAFWEWVTSWAVCLNKPSDLGESYSDDGYVLPPLNLVHEEVPVDHSRAWADAGSDGQAALFVDGNRSATDIWSEKRETLAARVQRVVEIVSRAPGEPWIIWHDTDYERDAIKAALPEATVVTGSQTPEEKEALLTLFAEGHARIMATKPKIGGWGLNFQHCANMVFMGVTHKFEEFYQALGRCHRYGQTRPVNAYVVYAESEAGIVESLRGKWAKHEEMHAEMIAAVKEHGLRWQGSTFALDTHAPREVAEGPGWAMHLGDSVLVLREVPENTVHLSVSSWPFSDQYTYSSSAFDMGNCAGDVAFFEQMGFLLPELLRVTVPGRMALVHAKDRIVYGSKNDGYAYIQPFSDDCIRAMTAAGWLFYGRITIATDPVRENNHTNRLGYGNLQKDATRIGVGMPEYLLLFRKPHRQTAAGGTWSDEPVLLAEARGYTLPRWQVDANSTWRTNGRRVPESWEVPVYDYAAHVASVEEKDRRGELGHANGKPIPTEDPGVWWDIKRTNCLNNLMAREQRDERHICPLQLDLIERAIARWSNPGDSVLDYFMGIGSVGYVAIQQGRQALGVELKRAYWEWACRYLERAVAESRQGQLFTIVEGDSVA